MGKRFRFLAAAATIALIAGCGEQSEEGKAAAPPALTAATLGEQQVLTAGEYLAQPPYSDADQSNGARQAQVCRACHSFDDGEQNMLGPALYGFFGTEAASREGFDYSPALREATFSWTPRALNAWLAQPGRFLPGNRMTFAGVLRDSDRDDLIAYLLTVTTGGGAE